MVSITAKIASTIDSVSFTEELASEFRNGISRVVRSKALDGSVVIDHRGFVDGDRTLKIVANLDESTVDDLWYLFRNETLLNLACKEGFFDGAISDMNDKNGQVELTFLVQQ